MLKEIGNILGTLIVFGGVFFGMSLFIYWINVVARYGEWNS